MMGARLREARESAGITKEHAAESAGAQVSAVTAWERGTALPTLVQVKGLLACYGMSPHQLLFGSTPVQFTPAEAAHLARASHGFGAKLRVKVDLLLTLIDRAESEPATS